MYPEIMVKVAFEKWLFIHLAGVLLGSKTGELLILRAEKGRPETDRQIDHIAELAPLWKYSYFVRY